MSAGRARTLRNNPTDAERYRWQQLRNRYLRDYKFRRQQALGSYIVDLVCFEARLIVELDGGQHSDNQGYDRARDEWLRSQGFHVLRFWNDEVFEQTAAVLDRILELSETPTS